MKTKDTPKQYVIYSRKSKFTGKGESIENQIELCRQYIAMHFGEEAAENVLVYLEDLEAQMLAGDHPALHPCGTSDPRDGGNSDRLHHCRQAGPRHKGCSD